MTTSSSNITKCNFTCTGYDDVNDYGFQSIYADGYSVIIEDDITDILSSDDEKTVYVYYSGEYVEDSIYLKSNNIENIENIKSAKLNIKYSSNTSDLDVSLWFSQSNKNINLDFDILDTSIIKSYDVTEYITSNSLNVDVNISASNIYFGIDYINLDIEYEQQETVTSNMVISDKKINKMFVGDKAISKMLLGDILIFDSNK